MSASHKDVLKQLFPINLGGVFDADIEIEGKYLDEALAAADAIVLEMHPDTATELTIADWERVCGLPSDGTKSLAERRAAVSAVWYRRGGLSRAYYTAVAAALGYDIEITECEPWLECGLAQCGDTLGGDPWIWLVTIYNDKDKTQLEVLFKKLKPAHTQVAFEYGARALNVVSVTPEDESTGIAVNASFTVTVDADIDASTVSGNVTVTADGDAVAISTVISGAALTITPAESLPAGADIIVTLGTGLQSITGASLSTAYAWNFTTTGNFALWITGQSLQPADDVDFCPGVVISHIDTTIDSDRQAVGTGCWSLGNGKYANIGEEVSGSGAVAALLNNFSLCIYRGDNSLDHTIFDAYDSTENLLLSVYIDSGGVFHWGASYSNSGISYCQYAHIWWTLTGGIFTLYLDGEPISMVGTPSLPDGIVSLRNIGAGGISLINNIMAAKSTSINLYKFRGFDAYTAKMPPEPDTPSDEIFFFLVGMKNINGMPAVRHYANAGENGGLDYTGGIWLDLPKLAYDYNYPKLNICDTPVNPSANGSLICAGDVHPGFMAKGIFKEATSILNLGVLFKDQYSSSGGGIYIQDESKNTRVDLTKYNYGYNNGYISVTVNGQWLEYCMYAGEDKYFIQLLLNGNQAKIWFQGTLKGTYSLSTAFSAQTGWSMYSYSPYALNKGLLMNNLILSKSTELDMYGRGYHLLTSYPKLEE